MRKFFYILLFSTLTFISFPSNASSEEIFLICNVKGKSDEELLPANKVQLTIHNSKDSLAIFIDGSEDYALAVAHPNKRGKSFNLSNENEFSLSNVNEYDADHRMHYSVSINRITGFLTATIIYQKKKKRSYLEYSGECTKTNSKKF